MRIGCKVCDSGYEEEVDRLIRKGEPISRISKLYGFSETTMRRHRDRHYGKPKPVVVIKPKPVPKPKPVVVPKPPPVIVVNTIPVATVEPKPVVTAKLPPAAVKPKPVIAAKPKPAIAIPEKLDMEKLINKMIDRSKVKDRAVAKPPIKVTTSQAKAVTAAAISKFNVAKEVLKVYFELWAIEKDARKRGDDRLAITSLREALRCNEIALKAAEIFTVQAKDSDMSLTIVRLLASLEPYADAREAAAKALLSSV